MAAKSDKLRTFTLKRKGYHYKLLISIPREGMENGDTSAIYLSYVRLTKLLTMLFLEGELWQGFHFFFKQSVCIFVKQVLP